MAIAPTGGWSIKDSDWANWGRKVTLPGGQSMSYDQYASGNFGSNRTTNSKAINDLVAKLESQSASARAANLDRYNEAMGIYSKIEQMYQPGGSFQSGAYAQLDRMKKQDLASSAQSAVDRGLSKTTQQQYASQRWTQEVGAPAIQQIEAQAQQLLSQAMTQRAGFIERREDVGPDYATIAQLVMAANS